MASTELTTCAETITNVRVASKPPERVALNTLTLSRTVVKMTCQQAANILTVKTNHSVSTLWTIPVRHFTSANLDSGPSFLHVKLEPTSMLGPLSARTQHQLVVSITSVTTKAMVGTLITTDASRLTAV